jgi:hypothetical protein
MAKHRDARQHRAELGDPAYDPLQRTLNFRPPAPPASPGLLLACWRRPGTGMAL